MNIAENLGPRAELTLRWFENNPLTEEQNLIGLMSLTREMVGKPSASQVARVANQKTRRIEC